MKNILWKHLGFEVEITGDGSPSLRLLKNENIQNDDKPGESMHHSGGAASETELIYGKVIDEVMVKINDPRFLVVGLGLGYIEICIARAALRDPTQVVSIQSFEVVEDLKNLFLHYLSGSEELHPAIKNTYDLMMSFLSSTYEEHQAIRTYLLKSYQEGRWVISGALNAATDVNSKMNGILYDAFSSKTTPHLWDETFLESFLKEAADENCLFSTYACRSSLKKALMATGFEVAVREGFMGKRNSTKGLRGLFKLSGE